MFKEEEEEEELCGNHVHVHLCLRWTESCRLTLNKDDQKNHPEGLSALLKSLGINVFQPSSAEMAEMWNVRAAELQPQRFFRPSSRCTDQLASSQSEKKQDVKVAEAALENRRRD